MRLQTQSAKVLRVAAIAGLFAAFGAARADLTSQGETPTAPHMVVAPPYQISDDPTPFFTRIGHGHRLQVPGWSVVYVGNPVNAAPTFTVDSANHVIYVVWVPGRTPRR